MGTVRLDAADRHDGDGARRRDDGRDLFVRELGETASHVRRLPGLERW